MKFIVILSIFIAVIWLSSSIPIKQRIKRVLFWLWLIDTIECDFCHTKCDHENIVVHMYSWICKGCHKKHWRAFQELRCIFVKSGI